MNFLSNQTGYNSSDLDTNYACKDHSKTNYKNKDCEERCYPANNNPFYDNVDVERWKVKVEVYDKDSLNRDPYPDDIHKDFPGYDNINNKVSSDHYKDNDFYLNNYP